VPEFGTKEDHGRCSLFILYFLCQDSVCGYLMSLDGSSRHCGLKLPEYYLVVLQERVLWRQSILICLCTAVYAEVTNKPETGDINRLLVDA